MSGTESDVLLVGAGLANALIAHALLDRHPTLTITILEQGPVPFGDHTWSFHGPDLSDAAMTRTKPMVAHEWLSQRVVFPKHTRSLRASYHSLTSGSVRAEMARHANRLTIVTDAEVASLDPAGATLADGTRHEAPLVIDGTGFRPSPHLALGYQKFVGLELEVDGGHGETEPVIMDATVDQSDSYRFVYTLPQTPTRILVEDTHYADANELHEDRYRASALAYAESKGWYGEVVREESGVLPIALAFDVEKFWSDMPRDAVPVGMRAGFFQHITGYSLPLAMEVADLIAAQTVLETAPVFEAVHEHALALDKRQRFFRLLNRMMFKGAAPQERYKLLQRFYTMPETLIERFYGARLSNLNALRVVTGKPPIPISTALKCLSEKQYLETA